MSGTSFAWFRGLSWPYAWWTYRDIRCGLPDKRLIFDDLYDENSALKGASASLHQQTAAGQGKTKEVEHHTMTDKQVVPEAVSDDAVKADQAVRELIRKTLGELASVVLGLSR